MSMSMKEFQKRYKKDKEGTLQFFVDVANADFDTISIEDHVKLAVKSVRVMDEQFKTDEELLKRAYGIIKAGTLRKVKVNVLDFLDQAHKAMKDMAEDSALRRLVIKEVKKDKRR